jgi:hypothetical protein
VAASAGDKDDESPALCNLKMNLLLDPHQELVERN